MRGFLRIDYRGYGLVHGDGFGVRDSGVEARIEYVAGVGELG